MDQQTNRNGESQKDLDLFLANIETKLRGPFSSLDLAKAMSSAASLQRDQLTQLEYLRRIRKVIGKTDKITQLRVLIALLGLERAAPAGDDASTTAVDQEVWSILQQTQEASHSYEDWVRICSALIQGIMFDDEHDRALLGPEARKLLDKTTSQILDRVQALERKTEYEEDDDFVPSRLDKADAHPTLAPYRYALLNPSLLPSVLPEALSHSHFTVIESAAILQIDANLERAKLEDDKEHTNSKVSAISKSRATAFNGPAGAAAKATSITATLPGAAGASANKKPSAVPTRPKASMFMPAKKPAQVLQGGKTTLHARRAGAAQALLAKRGGRIGGAATAKAAVSATGGNAAAAATGGTAGAPAAAARVAMAGKGRAAALLGSHASSRMGSAKSRMMTIDVAEVQNLSQQREQQQQHNQQQSGSGLKRKLASTDSTHGTSKPYKQLKRLSVEPTSNASDKAATVTNPPTTEATSTVHQEVGAALVSAALSAYQGQQQQQLHRQQQLRQLPPPESAIPPVVAPSGNKGGLDWRDMLKKSNRLSDDDRNRIQLFFTHKVNPTPDQPTYRMKLHEERVVDPQTGNPIKETYYLDLDYTNFTSRQSKKTKRYKE